MPQRLQKRWINDGAPVSAFPFRLTRGVNASVVATISAVVVAKAILIEVKPSFINQCMAITNHAYRGDRKVTEGRVVGSRAGAVALDPTRLISKVDPCGVT